MLSFFVVAQVAFVALLRPIRDRCGGLCAPGGSRSSGQATAEYALVLLGAAAMALLLAAWATKSGKITELFDAVVGHLIDQAR